MPTKVIILDRDGVINVDSDEYIKSPDEWEPIKGSLEAMGKLYAAGYKIFVITNQSGVGRKLFSIGDLTRIHRKMVKSLQKFGCHIDAILYCPHKPDDGCDCRKPLPGMFLELADRINMPLDGIYAIGDSVRDLEAASSAGATPALVLTGKGRKSKKLIKGTELEDTPVYKNLADFTEQLLAEST